MVILETQDLCMAFGGLVALNKVDLKISKGEIHALIGPNGAGKTTLLNLVTRLLDPSGGTIRFDGKDLLKYRAHDVVRLGISRTFQHLELFPKLTALDNVIIGGHIQGRTGLIKAILNLPSAHCEQEDLRKRAKQLLDFVGIGHISDRSAAILTGGQGRLLGLARALMSGSKIVLFDELAAGLNTQETFEASHLVRRLRDEMGITVLIVEHDMNFVMNVSDRITVLNYGEKIAEGSPEEICNNPVVIEAYLGSGGRYTRA